MKMKLFHLLIVVSLFSCKRDKPVVEDGILVEGIQPGEGVFIINEGNFMWGNGEVYYYNYSTQQVFVNLFSTKNGIPLGDVAQSMTIIGNKGYVVLNNSGKIEVVNLSDFSSAGTITGFDSPRFSLLSASGKLLVTDLYADEISVVNLQNSSISSTIPFPGWSEEMVMTDQKIFVGNNENNMILVIDAITDSAIDTIITGNYCNSLVSDVNGKVWALCSGQTGVQATLHMIDPVNNSIVSTFTFPTGQSPWKLNINGNGTILYYLNNGVYEMPVNGSVLATSALIPEGSSTFYSLGIEPVSGDIYIGDAKDYVQNGSVLRYSSGGTMISIFDVGIIPGGFSFY
jgi:YVTN family beta-propeller protein